jgi:ABC-2 type transport system permease protein
MASAEAFEPNTAAPAPLARTRPFFWSVKRELWENRSITMGPLIGGALAVTGFFISLLHPIQIRHAPGRPAPHISPELPYDMAAAVVIFAGLVVAFFYCLAALNGERRDRSILFWKSMPVSDATAVLAKAAVPLAVIPLVTIAAVFLTETIMLAMSAIALMAAGKDPAAHWAELSLVRNIPLFVWVMLAMSLWHAPIYAWLLLVSAWAKRMTFLWAVGPWFGLFAIEAIAFQTNHIAHWVGYRFMGAMDNAMPVTYVGKARAVIPAIDAAKFFSAPGLWIGLAAAVVLITATIWMRRRREPI